MSDPRNKLKAKFDDSCRYANFGNVLMQLHVRGFRCHADTIIDIKSPITAFCGLNGTGKSTLLQLAACAYQNKNTSKPYYVSTFISSNVIDTKPFVDDAEVRYRYWENARSLSSPTRIYRSSGESSWKYHKRPERTVCFIGIKDYLPTFEQSDFMNRYPKSVQIQSQSVVDPNIKAWTDFVLSKGYEQIISNTLTYQNRRKNVNSVQHLGVVYSEHQMGYGEGRSQCLIRIIEELPKQSLLLIEEPEISLHASAQYKFGLYLMDVSIRKGHQILLTTHSDLLLRALPSESRIYMERKIDGIDLRVGLPDAEARSLMSEGSIKSLFVIVEDDYAQAILTEMIRGVDPTFLKTVEIVFKDGKGKDDIANALRVLSSTSILAAAVLDGDTNPSPAENIFKLPGSEAPEKELFKNHAVQEYILSRYQVDLNDFKANLVNVHHHDWFKRLAISVNMSESALIGEVARVYAGGIPENFAIALVDQLKDASGR